MRGIQRGNALRFRAERIAQHAPETITAVTDGKQCERVARAEFLPTTRDGFRSFLRGKRALELVRCDQDSHGVFVRFLLRRRLARLLHIEINQNLTRLSPIARADEAPIFQFVHDARGTSIAEPKAALEQ